MNSAVKAIIQNERRKKRLDQLQVTIASCGVAKSEIRLSGMTASMEDFLLALLSNYERDALVELEKLRRQ